jgi:hypothetical protein
VQTLDPLDNFAFSCASRSVPFAASKVGFALIACSTSAVSAGEWNRVHLCPGMSRS